MEFLALIVAVIVTWTIASMFNRRSEDDYRQRHYTDRYPDDYNQWHHPGPPQYPYYPPQYPQYPHNPYDPYQEQREYQLRRYRERVEYNRNMWFALAVVFGLGLLAIFFRREFAGDLKEEPVEAPQQDIDIPRAETSLRVPTNSTSKRYEQPYHLPKETIEEKNYYTYDRSTLPIYLQAWSSRFAHEATRSMQECQKLGLSCICKKVQENGRIWHRVYVGPFETVEAAGELKIALGESGWKVVRVE